MTTDQVKVWTGQFGRDYTERNRFAGDAAFNDFYVKRYGAPRDQVFSEWLSALPRNAKILEVGANIGNQLRCMQRIGFSRLYGVEIQRHCVDESRRLYEGLDIIEGSGFDIPFKDNWFDLVFTNNVLIHIAPADLPGMLKEIHRVSGGRVMGFEYFAPELTEIPYRGKSNLLWKADYAKLYRQHCPGLTVEREQLFKCLDEPGSTDKFFLLKKQ
jgi:pseudaminic acid biosynthesis-associated methylase